MPRTISIKQRVNTQREKVIQMQNELKRLQQLEQAEVRKEQTKRLCRRAGILESVLPDTAGLSDDLFKEFLVSHAANKFGINILNKLIERQKIMETGNAKELSSKSITVPEKSSKPAVPRIETVPDDDGDDAILFTDEDYGELVVD